MASSERIVLLAAGARPNFMKIAPLHRALQERHPGVLRPVLVHTGQHYDQGLSDVFFRDLSIPAPDHHLDVGSGSHAEQTAAVMVRFERVVEEVCPDVVVVVGDVNSTLACALVAKKQHVLLAHVEAGLRSFDETMPEEINRRVTDALADHLFVSERSGVDNLKAEGRPEQAIHFVGNVMIDTLLRQLAVLDGARIGPDGDYAVLTLHRPSNVDRREVLTGIVEALEGIAGRMPVLFPVHPRTKARLAEFGLEDRLVGAGVRVVPPLGYNDFLSLWRHARVVLTDSGGLQEETTALGVPCLTLRENTERPVTVELGTNRLVGSAPRDILEGLEAALSASPRAGGVPRGWDGRAGERIADVLAGVLAGG